MTHYRVTDRSGQEVARYRAGAEGSAVECPDPRLAFELRSLLARPLSYLAGSVTEQAELDGLRVTPPGSPEHERALLFELHRFGLEALPIPEEHP